MTKTQVKEKILRPDSKGRVALGSMARGVSSYRAKVDPTSQTITLEPYAEIPLHERWVFENPEILARIMRGIEQAERGQVVDLGSFSKYLDDNDCEDE